MIAQCIALAVSASAACRPYVGSLLACMMMAFFEALGALSSFWSLGGPFHTCCIACMAVFVSITNVAFSHVLLLQFVFTVSALLSVKTYLNAKLGS